MAEENMLKTLLNKNLSGYWDWNIAEDKQFMSSSFKALLGYAEQEIESGPAAWEGYICPEDRDRVKQELEQYLKECGEGQFNSNFRMHHRDGSFLWVTVSACIMERSKENKPIRMLGYITDITQERKSQEEVQQRATQDKDRLLNFSHAVAHNLRSHSSNIRMFTELIDTMKEGDEKASAWENLKKITLHLDEALDHLNDLIDLQYSLDHYLEEIPLLSAVNKTLEVLKAEIGKQHADIQLRIGENAVVNYNPAYLESVLLNLVSNALKYRHPQRNPEIKITYMESGPRKVLEVADNGIGIDLNRCEKRIFNIYQTFHGNKDAKGIGLFLVKNQVEAMGGSIEVESKVDTGTTFRVFFI